MGDITDQDKKIGYVAAILSMVFAVIAMFGPFSTTVCTIIMVLGFIGAIAGIIKGDTGAKIIAAIGLLMNLCVLFLAMVVFSL